MGLKMGWKALMLQLKIIKASNPRRVVSRITFGRGMCMGSMVKLREAAGDVLTHLDMTGCREVKNMDFDMMGKQLPHLKGLAVRSTIGTQVGGG